MVTVIGAGLAGCEAAYTVAQQGIPVTLWEMKPEKYTPAHRHGAWVACVCLWPTAVRCRQVVRWRWIEICSLPRLPAASKITR